MTIEPRNFVASCTDSPSFQTASRHALDPLNPFFACDQNDVVGLDFVGGETVIPG